MTLLTATTSSRRGRNAPLRRTLHLAVLLLAATEKAAEGRYLRLSSNSENISKHVGNQQDTQNDGKSPFVSSFSRQLRNVFFHFQPRHPAYYDGGGIIPFAPSFMVGNTGMQTATSSPHPANTNANANPDTDTNANIATTPSTQGSNLVVLHAGAVDTDAGGGSAPASTSTNTSTTAPILNSNASAGNVATTRIIGGQPVQLDPATKASPYPWFVQWGDFCGGTLVHPDIMLTAAHCLDVDMHVWIGSMAHSDGKPLEIDASTVRIHPQYDGGHHFDLMVLKLRTAAPASVVPAVLNKDFLEPHDGMLLTAIGFGVTSENGMQSNDLREVNVTKFTKEECEKDYSDGYTYVNSFMFCAGTHQGGKDSCQGDSGGPIVDAESHAVMGIISHGEGCAEAPYPGVYQRIDVNLFWIQTQICQLSKTPPADCYAQDTVRPYYHQVKLDIVYDQFPDEISWTLRQVDPDSGKVIKVILKYDFDQITSREPGPMYFDQLVSGAYEFVMDDKGGDGMCCSYGQGSVQATHINTDTLLFAIDGKFESQVVKRFVLEEPANVQTAQGNNAAAGQSQGPVQRTVRMVVVVRYDFFPKETAWTLEVLPAKAEAANTAPRVIAESKFGDVTKSQVVQTPLDLAPGGYRFTIKDKSNDGINGGLGQGWIELRQWDEVKQNDHAVWRSDGKFKSTLTHTFTVK